jgi:hypothetical protein
MSNVIENLVEVTLGERDDFLKVKETLTRIGVASKRNNTLYQSCHILHKQGRYFITHFKELFVLDGKPSSITEDDLARRNTIAKLLDEWGLVALCNPDKIQENLAPISQIKILPYKERGEWELVAKYNIGNTQQPSGNV